MKQDIEFQLTEKQEQDLDSSLVNSIYSFTSEELPDAWVHTTLAMPKDFFPIFKETLEAYKALLLTDKTFPALEALILEARNSLPQV